MTDRILVDFNSRDDRGYLPAARRRLVAVPAVGSLVDAMDDEGNRCLARVVAVDPRSVTLEPLWQTFAPPEQSRLLPASRSQPDEA